MQDYIVIAPKYSAGSNGVRTLHKICHTINQQGGRSRMLFIASDSPECQDIVLRDAGWTNPEWNTPPLPEFDQHLFDNACVIYPEIIVGNPLKAKKVVRYFGNREAFCNGMTIGLGADDFLLAHSRATRQDAHCILFNSEINPIFNDRGTLPTLQRSLNMTYIGKGYLYGPVGMVDDTLVASRHMPTSQQQLAVCLRATRILYTWDSWSQVNVEAILCGAIPCVLRYDPWTSDDVDSSEIGRMPRIDTANKNIDIEKFKAERAVMLEKIKALASSWDQRTQHFTASAAAYFSQRGMA